MPKGLTTKTAKRGDSSAEKTPVKGGWVSRDSRSGRLIAVSSESGTSHSSDKSVAATLSASARRSEALKRLADR